MGIPTSRTNEQAEIVIDVDKCTGCGLCVSVCKDFSLILVNNKAVISNYPLFGCIACGHCMAICKSSAIEIYGRTMTPDNLFVLPKINETATYDQLDKLYKRRRSLREFSHKEVNREIIEKIIKSSSFSPMGLPPSDVNILVFDNRSKNRAFAKDFCDYLEGMKWMVSNSFLLLMRPIWGKVYDQLFRFFVKPLINTYTDKMKEGVDLVFYDAPLVMYFYGSPYSDPADPIITATYAMLTAESLGLGTCMIGAVHPLIQSGKNARKFRESHGIKYKSREGLFVIFGFPSVKYDKGIERSFASVTFV